MIEIKLDEYKLRKIYLKKLEEYIEKLDKEHLFWDSKDLVQQTRLCWDTIQKEFFYDPRFPKRKVGRKWIFPAKQTKEFLLTWLEEQGA